MNESGSNIAEFAINCMWKVFSHDELIKSSYENENDKNCIQFNADELRGIKLATKYKFGIADGQPTRALNLLIKHRIQLRIKDYKRVRVNEIKVNINKINKN